LAWSPDGKYIASPLGQVAADGEFMSVAEINVETGEQRIVTDASGTASDEFNGRKMPTNF
jgi:hypothetical protein